MNVKTTPCNCCSAENCIHCVFRCFNTKVCENDKCVLHAVNGCEMDCDEVCKASTCYEEAIK